MRSNHQKFISLWAFSESVFGGILHAMKIPFTGLFLSGFAVIFLSQIANSVENKTDIIKSTITVIVIKALISPNSPITAHFAVFIQGLFAFIFFASLRNNTLSIILLSLFSSIYSAFQKIFITTILFGMTFWNSIDDFMKYVLKIFGVNHFNYSFSLILVIIYLLIHLFGAIFFAIITIRIPIWLEKNSPRFKDINEFITPDEKINSQINFSKKRKKWYKKPSRVALLLFLVAISLLTVIDSSLEKIKFIDVMVMIVRASLILFVWFKFILPFTSKIVLSLVKKYNSLKFQQVNESIDLFPLFKKIIAYSWKINSDKNGLYRIKNFFRDVFVLLLMKT